MNFETYKKSIKKQLVEDENIVFQNLDEILKQNSDAFDNLIILQSNYNKLKRSEIANLLSYSELTIEYSKIRDGLIQLINSLRIEDLIFPKGVILEKKEINQELLEEKSGKARVENFMEESDWNNLLKIGKWDLNQGRKVIAGSGVFQYLLSNQTYGIRPFTLITTLKFEGIDKNIKNGLDKGNSGIVLGWTEQEEKRSYYHLLLTGEKILFEGVGIYGGDEYLDFVHLDSGVNFELKEGKDYEIAIIVGAKRIDLFIDNQRIYSINRPDGMIGKVGIRPWRARIECKYFEIRER